MLNYSEKIMKLNFSDISMKEAFLKASKWVATNIISNPELCDIQVSYKKIYSEEKLLTIELTLYVVLDEKELRERHCTICKETHSTFFMNSEVKCSECKLKAYQNRADQIIKVKRDYLKGILRRKDINEGDC